MIGPLVTVAIDGAIVASEQTARLQNGLVVAPIVPFAQAIATQIDALGQGRYRVTGGGRSVVVRADARGVVALGRLARALGERVSYDARRRALAIELPVAPLGAPRFSPAIPPGPYATFAPVTAPTPRPVIDGIPVPRRTPIEAGPERSIVLLRDEARMRKRAPAPFYGAGGLGRRIARRTYVRL